MSKVRILFDGINQCYPLFYLLLALIQKYPTLASHIAKDAEIASNQTFDNAVVKVRKGKERLLSVDEKELSIIYFFLFPWNKHMRLMMLNSPKKQSILQPLFCRDEQCGQEARREPNPSSYVPLLHLSPTSNIVERLFSVAKNVLSDNRKSMTPYHLELLLLFLRCNKSLWDEVTIQEILDRPRTEDIDDSI